MWSKVRIEDESQSGGGGGGGGESGGEDRAERLGNMLQTAILRLDRSFLSKIEEEIFVHTELSRQNFSTARS